MWLAPLAGDLCVNLSTWLHLVPSRAQPIPAQQRQGPTRRQEERGVEDFARPDGHPAGWVLPSNQKNLLLALKEEHCVGKG